MAESSTNLDKSESELMALQEAIFAQQQLLQKLYNELDVEREASATAASEALSMILRLQGEKAAVKMEANQYKRLVEEKMWHAEEALAIFEDLMYQKEMEIAFLEFQVQAYRHKLLSLGCSGASFCEKFTEDLLQNNGNVAGDQRTLRRNSMPPMPLKFSNQNEGIAEGERSESPELIPKVEEKNEKDQLNNSQSSITTKRLESSAFENIDTYWEQIRRLDESVREIVDPKGVKSSSLRSGSRSPSFVSQASMSLLLDSSRGATAAKSCQIEYPENFLQNEATFCSSDVHDVFEVPQTCKNDKSIGGETKSQSEKVGKANAFGQNDHKSSLFRPTDRVSVDYHAGIGVSESDSKVRQLNMTSAIVEVERRIATKEATNSGEEALKLLKEIQKQLDSLESQIKSWKAEKFSPSYEVPLLSLTEAMLHFWL